MLRGENENGEGDRKWQVETVDRAPAKASPKGDFCVPECCWGRTFREANPLTQELEWRHLGRRRETARGGAELAGPKGVYKEPGFSEGPPPARQQAPQAMWGSPRSRVPLAATWRIDCRQQGRSGPWEAGEAAGGGKSRMEADPGGGEGLARSAGNGGESRGWRQQDLLVLPGREETHTHTHPHTHAHAHGARARVREGGVQDVSQRFGVGRGKTGVAIHWDEEGRGWNRSTCKYQMGAK